MIGKKNNPIIGRSTHQGARCMEKGSSKYRHGRFHTPTNPFRYSTAKVPGIVPWSAVNRLDIAARPGRAGQAPRRAGLMGI
jgi:hypothetical protein